MPHLDVAARHLGVSEKTLRKWLRQVEPPIEPTPHKRDRRYHVISDAEVERLRQALAERPGVHTPPVRTDAHQTRYGANLGEQPSKPSQVAISPAGPRQRAVSASPDGLPDGWMDVTAASRAHNIPRSTLAAWVRDGRIETDSGEYGGEHGQWRIVRPLTRRGLAQLVALARGREGWRDCPLCPHEEDTFRDTGGDTPTAR